MLQGSSAALWRWPRWVDGAESVIWQHRLQWVIFAEGWGPGRRGHGSPPCPPGWLLADETVTVLKQFGQRDFKLGRDLTCIPVTFDMLILWK